MRIVGDQQWFPGWLVTKIRPPERVGCFFLKGTFVLKAGEPCVWAEESEPVVGDSYQDDDLLKSLVYASDFAPIKPRTDVLLNATAHAPPGGQSNQFEVRFQIGSIKKILRIWGKRTWKQSLIGSTTISPPEPISTLPIIYEHAFGGSKTTKNPVGLGFQSEFAPQIEDVNKPHRSPRDEAAPAGFGPLSPFWAQRQALVGTYTGNWAKERWPWFPENFDWGYFNAAPRDQQLDQPLRGDEPFELENLHPELPLFRSRLPGIRPKLFIDERPVTPGGDTKFREIPLKLDTVFIDVPANKLIMVWRGQTPVRTTKLKELENLFMHTEAVTDKPKSSAEYRQLFLQTLHAKDPEDEMPIPPPPEPPDDMDKAMANLEKLSAQAEADGLKAEAEMMQKAAAEGRIFPPDKPEATVSEIMAELTAQSAEMKAAGADPAQLAMMAEEIASLQEVVLLEASLKAMATEDQPTSRDDVIASIKAKESFAKRDLVGLDLSGLDFTGLDFRGAKLRETKLAKAKFAGVNLTGADFTGADLTDADLTGANLDRTDFAEALLKGTKVQAVSLTNASFPKLDLTGLDFTKAHGRGPDFSQSKLKGAKFVDAKIPQADFCKCDLENADFRNADLQAVQMEKTKAPGAQFEGADLTGLHGSDGSDFTSANFRAVRANGAIWEDSCFDLADFSKAQLRDCQFPDTSLRGTKFDRADMTKAVFDDALLEKAIMTNANLFRASFERADLTEADIQDSNLYGAGFCEALTNKTNFRGSNLKGTRLG